jgi:multidrug efflux pump subunit AcrB
MPFGRELVFRAMRERLSPILTSSAAIIAALLPFAVLGWIPGLEIARQAAIAVTGGLAASTLATLFVIPALWLVAGRGAEREPDLGLLAG